MTNRTDRKTLAFSTQTFDLDAVDQKGRKIGSLVELSTFEYFDIDETQARTGYYTRAAGVYFAYEPTALRDGKPFGAIQQTMIFDTEAQRDAAVLKYVANARKRAAKKG